MTTKQIERLIEKAYTEMGIRPDVGAFDCCAIGAACQAKGRRPMFMVDAAAILGRSGNWTFGVIQGFDGGTKYRGMDARGFAFGRRMRRKWLKRVSGAAR